MDFRKTEEMKFKVRLIKKQAVGLSTLFLFVLGYCLSAIPANGDWLLALVSLLLTVPITITHAYSAHINRAHWLTKFDQRGHIIRIFSGFWFKILISLTFGTFCSFSLIVEFFNEGSSNIAFVSFGFLLILFFLIHHIVIKSSLILELAPFYRVSTANSLSKWIAFGVSIPLLAIYLMFFNANPELNIYSDQFEEMTSATIGQLALFKYEWSIREAFLIGKIAGYDEYYEILSLLFIIVTKLGAIYALVSIIPVFLTPSNELRRILLPVSTELNTPSVPIKTVYWASFFGVLLILIWFQLFAMLEREFTNTPYEERPATLFTSWVKQKEIVICETFPNSTFCHREGTHQKVAQVRKKLISDRLEACQSLDREFERGLGLMSANVEKYLDWHFSIKGDYSQLAAFAIGNSEEFLIQRFYDILLDGQPFSKFELKLNALKGKEKKLSETVKIQEEKVLNENKIEIDDNTQKREIQRFGSLDLSEVPKLDAETFARIGIGAGVGAGAAGLASVAIAKAVSKKVVAKGTFKLAGKLVAKILAKGTTKVVAGAITGGATGAAVGSIVPVFGTIIGAFAGVATGVGTALLADKAMIEWDEKQNREELREELISNLKNMRPDSSFCN